MISNMLSRMNIILNKIEQQFFSFIFKQSPPPGICFNIIDTPNEIQEKNSSVLEYIFDGFLLAVPKERRTIEKRWKRKYGHLQQLKIYYPKTNLLTCNECGHFHEKGVLCPNCYKKIVKETEEIKEAIQKDIGLKPIENDVIVLYEGETVPKNEENEETWKGKRIVELSKKRPEWFSKNLLQKSTISPSTSTDIKPSDLG